MKITIHSDKALPILSRLNLPPWNKLDVNQQRQVAMEIYQNDNSPEGRKIYTLLSTGNPAANDFVYQVVVKPESNNTKKFLGIAGIGILLYFLSRD